MCKDMCVCEKSLLKNVLNYFQWLSLGGVNMDCFLTCFFKVYFTDYAITVVPFFSSPLSPSALHPSPSSILPSLSWCHWVVHISSLASPFPILFLTSLSHPCLFLTYLPLMLLVPCTFFVLSKFSTKVMYFSGWGKIKKNEGSKEGREIGSQLRAPACGCRVCDIVSSHRASQWEAKSIPHVVELHSPQRGRHILIHRRR